MPWQAEIHAVLRSFFGLLTRPFEQSPADSVRGAVTAIVLSMSFAGFGEISTTGAATSGLALVVVWMLISAVFTGADRRTLEVARNVSVISFWIAATSALVLVAEQVHPDCSDRGPRVEFVWYGLLFLVPVHMFKSLRFGAAFRMTLALWVSTGLLARWLVD